MVRLGGRNTRNLLAQRRATLRKYQGNRCCWCGKAMQQTNPNKWDYETLEHLRPRSRKGTDAITNLALAHKRCNEERGSEERKPLIRHIIE